MRIPRDVRAKDFVILLEHLGYRFVRQKGSHARYTHLGPPRHSLTVPMHNILDTGTLYGMLSDVADHLKLNIQDLIADLK